MSKTFKEDKVYKFSVKKYLEDGYTDRKDEDHKPIVTPSSRFSDSGEWGIITLKNGNISDVHRDWCKVVKGDV